MLDTIARVACARRRKRPVKESRQEAWLPQGLLAVVWGWCLIWESLSHSLPSVASAGGQTELAYAKGVLEYGNRNYLDALEHLRRAVNAEPHHPDAQFYLGLTLLRLGEFQDAGAALETALHLDVSKRYVHHHLGMVYLHLQRYDNALAQLHLAEQYDAANSATQFYLGYTYYQAQQYLQAPPYLQRASELDPSRLLSAQYYRGLAFYAAERDQPSRQAFEWVVHTDPASPLADNAQRYLEALKHRSRQPRLLRLQGRVGFEYDDNVVLEPNDAVFEFGQQDDGRTVVTFSAQLLPMRTPTWHLGATYDLFQSVHFELHDFDVQSHTGGLFAHLNVDRLTFRAEASYNLTLLDLDHFSHSVTVQPSLVWRQTDALFTIVSASFNHTDFLTPLSASEDPGVRDRDGWLVRAGIRQFLLFNQNQSSFELGYHYEGSRNDGTDWEYDSYNITLGLHTPLGWEITLDLDGAYHRRHYRHINSFDAKPLAVLSAADRRSRQDDRLVGSVALARAFGSSLTLSLSYVHTRNLSNIDFLTTVAMWCPYSSRGGISAWRDVTGSRSY